MRIAAMPAFVRAGGVRDRRARTGAGSGRVGPGERGRRRPQTDRGDHRLPRGRQGERSVDPREDGLHPRRAAADGAILGMSARAARDLAALTPGDQEAVRAGLISGGAPPHTPAQSLAGTPTPRAASSRARTCARRSTTWGSAPHPGSVACGDPYAPRRFLAGAHVRAVPQRGVLPHTPAQSLAGTPTPRAASSRARTCAPFHNVGLCPTPRLSRLRGPLCPAPLPRGRARARRSTTWGSAPHKGLPRHRSASRSWRLFGSQRFYWFDPRGASCRDEAGHPGSDQQHGGAHLGPQTSIRSAAVTSDRVEASTGEHCRACGDRRWPGALGCLPP